MEKKKGFTLIEVLIVVVIISVLATGIIGLVSRYLKNGKEKYDDNLENSLLLAGKDYYVSNRDKLPKNGGAMVVSLAELRSLNLINKDFIDAYGNKCSNEDSLVMVTNNNGKYEYTACLYCEKSNKFSESHLDICDPRNVEGLPEDNEPPKEKPTCKILKENDDFIIYDKDGKLYKKSSGLEAIKELSNTCNISKNTCQTNVYTLDDGSKITYYYGSVSKPNIYSSIGAAQSDGVCKETCIAYKLQDGYDAGIGTTYKKSVSTTSEITKNSQLSSVFGSSVNSFEDGTSYYLHYVKNGAYEDILAKDSSGSSSVTPTNGKTSTLTEYFNPSTKAKVTKSTNSKVHYNEAIPDEYELALSGSSTESTVTIPKDLKMTQKQINQWGTDYSKYAKYGRVVLAAEDAKGNYKARYSNVGSYNGVNVDVLMTLTGFSGCKLKSGTSKCGIWFEPKTLQIYSLGVKRISVKYEFFKAGTNTPITVKGYSTYWDIDANQGIHFIKGTTGIYAYGTNELYVSLLESAPYVFEYNDKKYNGYNEKVAITETFSGSVLTKAFTFMSGNDGDHSKVTSSYGSIAPSTIPIGVSKEYVGSVNSESVLKKNQIIKFRIRYSNMSSSEKTLTIKDTLTGMTYQNGTAKFNDGTIVNPTVSGDEITWTKKVAALSSGYVTYEVKVNSCGDLTESYATLKVGTTTFKSRRLKNIAVCSKQVNTICSKFELS